MKRSSFGNVLALVFLLLPAFSQATGTADEQDQLAYQLILKADTHFEKDQLEKAGDTYLEAMVIYSNVRKTFPDYKADILNFRIDYCQSQLEKISAKLHKESEPQTVEEWEQKYNELFAAAQEQYRFNKKLQQELAVLKRGEHAADGIEALDAVRKENRELVAKMNAMQSEFKNLQQSNDALITTRSELKAANETLEADIAQLKEDSQGELANFKEQLAALSAEKKESDTIAGSLRAALAEQEKISAKNKALLANNEALASEKKESEAMVHDLRSKLEDQETLIKKHKDLLAANATLNTDLQELESTVIARDTRVKELEAELAAKAKEFDNLNGELQESEASSAELHNRLGEIDIHKARVAEMQQQLFEKVQAEQDSLKNLKVLAETIRKQRVKIDELSGTLDDLVAQVTTLEGVDAKLATSQDELRATQRQLKVAEVIAKQTKADLLVLKEHIHKLRGEQEGTKKELEKTKSSLSVSQQKLEDSERETRSLTEQNEALTAQRKTLMDELDVTTIQLKKLSQIEAAFTENHDQFKSLQQNYRELAQNYQNVKRLHDRNAGELALVKKALNTSDATVSKQKEELLASSQKIQTLEAEIKALEKAHAMALESLVKSQSPDLKKDGENDVPEE